jgi:hypothetical protein
VRVRTVNFPITVSFRRIRCDWKIKVASEDVDCAVFKRKGIVITDRRSLDAWEVRQKFLQIATVAELDRFLNWTGPFRTDDTFQKLGEWQGLIRALLVTNPQQWASLANQFDPKKVRSIVHHENPRCSFIWTDGKPKAVLLTSVTLQAIVASTQIDHLRGAKFRFCMKPDCRQEYEVTSAHMRLYCSQACAHHASVRRNRAKR